jgi:hypothetical protein
MTLFAANPAALLNKVIHRPVESIGNPKIIFGLPANLKFHFNFVRMNRAPLRRGTESADSR